MTSTNISSRRRQGNERGKTRGMPYGTPHVWNSKNNNTGSRNAMPGNIKQLMSQCAAATIHFLLNSSWLYVEKSFLAMQTMLKGGLTW